MGCNAQDTLTIGNRLGYFWEFGGEAETSGKGNASIGAKLPIAGLMILFLLVAQFNSLRKPLIILLTIPLGLIGVVIGLHLTNLYFGFMPMLGVLSLAGIIINNAITDVQGQRRPGEWRPDPARYRLRPVRRCLARVHQ